MMNNVPPNNALAAGRDTILRRLLASTSDNQKALQELYVRVFARGPNPKEQQICLSHIKNHKSRGDAFADIQCCLVNSTEFITRH